MKLVSEKDFEEVLLKCVNRVSDYVLSTYGPRGQNVLISDNNKTFLTKDGVTVAKHIDGDDELENAIIKIIKQCTDKTVQDAGDGTTTSILFLKAFVTEILKICKVWSDVPKMQIFETFRNKIQNICNSLEDNSLPVSSKEMLHQVALIASNNDAQIAELITTLLDSVGVTGTVSITESKGKETTIKIMEGVRFGSKILANSFLPENKEKLILSDCVVVVSTTQIKFTQEIIELLTNVSANKKSLLFVCPDMHEQLLLTLAANVERGSLNACVLTPSYLGNEKLEVLEDIAMVCGTVPSHTSTLNRSNIKEWGYARNIEITRNLCTIVDGNASPEQLDSMVETLKKRVAESEDEFIINKLIARINRLTSTVGVLYVGGQTAADAIERKYRAEDALESCNSAMKKGVIPGGGTLLRYYGSENSKEKDAFENMVNRSVLNVCKEQSIKLYGPELVPYKLHKKQIKKVFDLSTNKFVDWVNCGIFESVWTVQSALKNAFVTAWLLVNCYGMIVK